ncbi:hypothetical protein SKAU_G00226280 [Synaphobranchus kaupii]|uniref:Uncharacterized protein n=1 Tax=Synaphobranchus kaupii TaxID=118154 RepID=A0A9Q1F4Q3_SYNKA|nr:hypothetical protein SKAU_G00226280 [Synaphobranchus kaupii]
MIQSVASRGEETGLSPLNALRSPGEPHAHVHACVVLTVCRPVSLQRLLLPWCHVTMGAAPESDESKRSSLFGRQDGPRGPVDLCLFRGEHP